jgi:hypothetical protein
VIIPDTPYWVEERRALAWVREYDEQVGPLLMSFGVI